MSYSYCFYVSVNISISVSYRYRGDDYKSHTQCISEDQKYGGKGYEAKSKKGDVKQQQWIQVSLF